jgi:hypothetical protein
MSNQTEWGKTISQEYVQGLCQSACGRDKPMSEKGIIEPAYGVSQALQHNRKGHDGPV